MNLKIALAAGLVAVGAAGAASAANCTCRPVHRVRHIIYRHALRGPPERAVYGYPVPYPVEVATPVYDYPVPTYVYGVGGPGYGWDRGYSRGYAHGSGYGGGFHPGYGRGGFEGRGFGDEGRGRFDGHGGGGDRFSR